MASALYFPFSRCLDELALKKAVLVYDRLLFVDPVTSQERAALYTREAAMSGADPKVAQRWARAQAHYELLEQERISESVDPAGVLDANEIDALAGLGLATDSVTSRAGRLFTGRRRWQMLERRVPPCVYRGSYELRRGSHGWHGEPVVDVPYTVGASLTLTYAMQIAQTTGATLMTDNDAHHRLLLFRLQAGADGPPGMHAPRPSPYKRRQIELRVVEALAPDTALRRMSFEEVLEYRRASASARQDLTKWIDRLTREASTRTWDPDFSSELDAIADHAREIAAEPGRWAKAFAAARRDASPATAAEAIVAAAGPATLATFVIPHVTLIAALAVGASAVASKAVGGAVDALMACRTPEQKQERNAVTYLLSAGQR